MGSRSRHKHPQQQQQHNNKTTGSGRQRGEVRWQASKTAVKCQDGFSSADWRLEVDNYVCMTACDSMVTWRHAHDMQ